MIVRSIDEGWRIIFHAAHGLLAEEIASYLEFAEQLPFWKLTKIAIGMHDDGKQPFLPGQRSYLTRAGAPKDFTLMSMKSDDRVEDAKRQIWEAKKKHRWIGCLVSFHTDFLYRGEDVSGEMRRLLDEEIKWRDRTITELEVSPELLQRSYDWMRWCDRCSLILCGDDVPAMGRQVEIITDSTGKRFDMSSDADSYLRIKPWPFAVPTFRLTVETRTVEQLTFSDDADLATKLREADVSIIEFKLRE